MNFDIAIFGGSLGGVQAAVSACAQGCCVYLCEETDWLGGQMSSQGVPPDEHPWIETQGATARYRVYRAAVRAHYQSRPDASAETVAASALYTGNAWVSHLCHEPALAASLFAQQLAPYEEQGLLTIAYHTVPVRAQVEGDAVQGVWVKGPEGEAEIHAAYYLDATECGDLLPMTGAEYRVGAQAKRETGEPSAPEHSDSRDMQSTTWVAALELAPGEPFNLEKPAMYDAFAAIELGRDGHKLFSWHSVSDATHEVVTFSMLDGERAPNQRGLWTYRRILDPAQLTAEPKEVTLLNWPQNDYRLGNLFDTNDASVHLELAKQQTLSFIYWLRHDAPRPDGGKGYPVRVRTDIFGTENGLAKTPYIRESRRIVAKQTICEGDVSRNIAPEPTVYADSVGVGSYAMDLHPTTRSGDSYYAPTWPFEIPLGALIPVRMKNLLPACKNIGCTHMTNGCYRLHPVEWNVGESAGHLAAYCVKHNVTPAQVLETEVEAFQQVLTEHGVQLHWNFDEMEGYGR